MSSGSTLVSCYEILTEFSINYYLQISITQCYGLIFLLKLTFSFFYPILFSTPMKVMICGTFNVFGTLHLICVNVYISVWECTSRTILPLEHYLMLLNLLKAKCNSIFSFTNLLVGECTSVFSWIDSRGAFHAVLH